MSRSVHIAFILVHIGFAPSIDSFIIPEAHIIFHHKRGRSSNSYYDNTQINSAPPKKRAQDDNYFDIYRPEPDGDECRIQKSLQEGKKSDNSSFWYSIEQSKPLTQEEVTPYQSKLDRSGDLPFGSYRLLGKEEYGAKRTCVLTIGLDFWNSYHNLGHERRVEIDTDQVLQNVHHLIDSGFKSFQLNECDDFQLNQLNKVEPSRKQAFIEQNIYHQLIKQTPRSVLNECSLSTRMNVPPSFPIGGSNGKHNKNESEFIFRESDVRQQIGQSILNMYGNTDGYLDSVQINFQPSHDNHGNQVFSPYTFDTLYVLQEMQREGLIRSINGLNFPHHAIDEIEQNGFALDYNQVMGNLLDPSQYTNFVQNQSTTQLVVNGVLGGGLLTNKFSNVPNASLNRLGEPIDGYMTSSELWHYKKSLNKVWVPAQRGRNMSSTRHRSNGWHLFQSKMMQSLQKIAYKHQVSIASVVTRWSMQLDQVGSVVVGSSLNTKYDNDGHPFTRPNDLREAFSFELDEDDMDKLWEISGSSRVQPAGSNMDDFGGDDIDFSNTKLWL